MAADIEVIWVGRERGNFCNQDWTEQIRLISFNYLDFVRRRAAAEFEASGVSASRKLQVIPQSLRSAGAGCRYAETLRKS
jgi:hypothetical protein